MNFERERTACFTGHREIKRDFDVSVLDAAIVDAINNGYNTFLCGMAYGFDLKSLERLNIIRKRYENIKAVACVPCPEQSKNFSAKDRKKYNELLKTVDEVIIVSPKYDEYCMKERDRFMVDNSSLLISYLYTASGGAYYTTKYAVDKNLDIVYVK